jgi:hypothetical protein
MAITTTELRSWSGVTATDPGTNDGLDEAVNAANGLVARRLRADVPDPWPDEVHTATLIQAARIFKRRGSPEGVAGFGDLGLVRVAALDADVETMLAEYLRIAFA